MPKKLEPGQKSAREKKQDLIEIKYKIGEDADGHAIRKSFYGKKKRDIKNAYDKFMLTYRHDSAPPTTMLFGDWAGKWLSTYKEKEVRTVTFQKTYEYSVNQHIIPYFKKIKLCEITPLIIKEFYNSKTQYSFSLLSKIRISLNAILNAAVNAELISKNPAREIKLPKSINDINEEKRAYTFHQARVLIDYAKNHKYGIGPIIMLKTGLRISELLALPIDYNYASKLLKISESVSDTKFGVEVNPCKTKRSRREIPFDDELLKVILNEPGTSTYRKKTVKKKYLISNADGDIKSPINYRSSYDSFMDDFMAYCSEMQHNIPRLTPHELRHTFGSVLFSRKIDIVTISRLMGHSSVAVTEKIYIHNDMPLKQAAIIKGL